MNFVAILTGLLCILFQYGSLAAQHGGETEVHCEGKEVELHFVFPVSRDINVALQIGNRAPFYDNGRLLEFGLSRDQFKRFQVKPHINHTHYELILTILNVSQEDGGTYIGLAYVRGEMETHLTKKIALVIEYPPGDPQCKFTSPSKLDVIHDTWDIIECTADIGTMPGYIACFQNNEALPLHGELLKNSTTILQRLWAKRSQMFSCCSSDFRHAVKAESCTAYQVGNNNFLTTPQITLYTDNSVLSGNDETPTMPTPFGEFISKTGLIRDSEHNATSFPFSLFEFVVLIVISLIMIIVLVVIILLIKYRKSEKVREKVGANGRNEEIQLLNQTIERSEELLNQTIERSEELLNQTIERSEKLFNQNIERSKEFFNQTIKRNEELLNQTIKRSEELFNRTDEKNDILYKSIEMKDRNVEELRRAIRNMHLHTSPNKINILTSSGLPNSVSQDLSLSSCYEFRDNSPRVWGEEYSGFSGKSCNDQRYCHSVE